MKRKLKSVCAAVMTLALCFNLVMPVNAANETNTLGITFDAVLDTSSVLESDADQTVVMRVNASKAAVLEGIGGEIFWDEPLELVAVSNDDSRIDFTGSYNLENGKIAWDGTADLDQLENVTSIVVATFKIPANTPAGEYTVGLRNLELCKNYGDIWEENASAQTTLTVEKKTVEQQGYTAGLTCTQSTVRVGESTNIFVGVSHAEDTFFAASEIQINYDSSKIAFNKQNSKLGEASVQETNGVLLLEDYGADKNLGSNVYELAFDAIQEGPASIELTSAAFVNKENAVKSDLIPAALSSARVSVTVNKKAYTVTLPDIFTGSSLAEEGEDYTFSQADSKNYTYGTVSATMGDTSVEVMDNGNGTYTIHNVSGDLQIVGSRTENTYPVTFLGNAAEDIVDAGNQATYNTDYSFTMPSLKGWAYSLESITIGGVPYSGYRVEKQMYTIPGTAIQGEIRITVNKVATEASVTVEGNGAGAASGYNPIVNIGEDYILTLDPETGYKYTVTASIDGKSVTVIDNGDNSYKVEHVTGSLVFQIDRVVIVDGVTISEYLTLDGSVMWLIQNTIQLDENQVPSYNGENMFWSEKYNCYCYLTIAPTLTQEDVADKVDIANGTAGLVDYSMDVNQTGKVDASDAQLIYNMYNALYSDFDADTTVGKFLSADVNADKKVDVQDAVTVVASLFH